MRVRGRQTDRTGLALRGAEANVGPAVAEGALEVNSSE